MEPRIQYAKTEDGMSIACTTTGEGPPPGFEDAVRVCEVRWRAEEGDGE